MHIDLSPTLNRTQRRQQARQLGWRGSKAKRQFPNRSAHRNVTADQIKERQAKLAQDAAAHDRRQRARHAGLIIPPSTEEMEDLKAQGKVTHDPRLLIPGD